MTPSEGQRHYLRDLWPKDAAYVPLSDEHMALVRACEERGVQAQSLSDGRFYYVLIEQSTWR